MIETLQEKHFIACDHPKIKKGDRITISGIRMGKQFKDGFTRRCKKGNETVFIAK